MAEHLLTRKFSWKLSILVFVAGLAAMSLEFSASRLLTPVFGSTIYTWGSLIGVILAGLSLGYFIGGRLADKKPSIPKLCSIIFSAGLYIVMIPFVSTVIIEFANNTFASPPQDSQYASLVATTALLITPTFLLGIISPYAVKLATSNLSRLGNIAGNFYALSTIGSIIGTFLTVFVLIPSFEIRNIIFSLGSILVIFASIIGLRWFPRVLAISTVVLLFLPISSLASGAVSHSGTLVYEKETLYSHLDVTDSGNIRTLYLNGLAHSAMYKDDPNELVVTYTIYFHLGFVFNDDVKNVLFVGGGGFSGPKSFLDTYPDVKIDVVEIDADVIDVAKQYFFLSSDSRLRIFNEDARSFLSRTDQNYDLIVLDAFSKTYVPFHLMTLEYFEILAKKLTPDGIIVSNLIGTLSGDTSNLLRAVYRTMSQVFPTLHLFTTRDYDFGEPQNMMVVATKTGIQYSKPQLAAILDGNDPIDTPDNYDGNNIDFVKHLHDGEIRIVDVPILTDQYAPVEHLLNPLTGRPYSIDEQISTERTFVPWGESGSIVILILGVIVFLWMAQMREIWKRQGQRIPRIGHSQ